MAVTGVRRRKDAAEFAGLELVDLETAARYLGCKAGGLREWIRTKRFTEYDGLRRVGDLLKVWLPALRERVAANKLMSGGPACEEGCANGVVGKSA